MNSPRILAATFLAAAASSAVFAASETRERQLTMKAMADASRTIDALFKGSRAYSQQDFKSAAESIRGNAGDHLVQSFRGATPSADSKTNIEALVAQPGEFDRLARELEIYAAALSSAADRNPAGLGPGTRMNRGTTVGSPFGRKADASKDAGSVPAEHAFHLMLQTCTSCHAKFRVETR
ncbi:cytochrome c [Sinorhizobium medicae]|nr:cytochrome c [Sinorhizobium medicae]